MPTNITDLSTTGAPGTQIPLSFSVEMYGELQPYALNPSKSVTRVRTFYKGLNRNRSFFVDQVAEYIINNMVGNPIIGFYDQEKKDFTQHFDIKTTKAYGHVPNPANFAWEKHLDKDGVTREYACFDVVLYTDRYEEAKFIIKASQSMEVNPKTSCGTWGVVNGEYVFTYSFAEVFGLCVLGKNVEPCFEGAAFYSLDNPNKDNEFITLIENMKKEIKQNFSLPDVSEGEDKGGTQNMPIKFNIPNDSKFELLFQAMNPDYTPEKEYEVDFMIAVISDKQMYAFSCNDGKQYLVDYAFDADGKAILEVPVAISVVGYTAEDLEAEKAKVTKQEFDLEVEKLKTQLDSANASLEAFNKIDYPATVSQLTQERDQLSAKLTEFTAKLTKQEEEKKNGLIDGYSRKLSEEELEPILTKMPTTTYEELEGLLAMTYGKKMHKLDMENYQSQYSGNTDPLTDILAKYKQGKED